MASREVERRISRNEPDDLTRRSARLKEDPDIDLFTDKNSWHLITDPYDDRSSTLYSATNSFLALSDEDHNLKIEDSHSSSMDEVEIDIYVRIMGELWAKFYRLRWNRNKKKRKKL